MFPVERPPVCYLQVPGSQTSRDQSGLPSTLPALESLTLRMRIPAGMRVPGKGRKKSGVPHRPDLRGAAGGWDRPGGCVPFLVEGQHGRAQDVVGDDGTHHHGHAQAKGSSLSPLLGHHQLLPHVRWGQQSLLRPQRHIDMSSTGDHPQRGRQVRGKGPPILISPLFVHGALQCQTAFLDPNKPPASPERRVLLTPFYR